MPQIKDDEELKKYLPEINRKEKSIDREFFFNILNTVYPDYMKKLIDHAHDTRN